MNVIGKLFVIHKHWRVTNDKPRRRAFYDAENIEAARDIALQYSDAQDKDFLIVSVVEEVSRPTKRAADVCHECGAMCAPTSHYCSNCGTRR